MDHLGVQVDHLVLQVDYLEYKSFTMDYLEYYRLQVDYIEPQMGHSITSRLSRIASELPWIISGLLGIL